MQTRKDEKLDFDAMDSFITAILAILKEEGSRAVRVFPPDANVLLSFSERVANEVVSLPLLARRTTDFIEELTGRRIYQFPVDASARSIK